MSTFPDNDPFLPSGRPTPLAGPPPSYLEVPGAGLTSFQRELALSITARVEELNPWKKTVTRGLLPEDLARYREGRLNATAADPTVNLGGPSALMQAFILPSDHSAPTPPSDISWGGVVVPISPRELIVTTVITTERFTLLVGFNEIVDGAPVPLTKGAFDLTLVQAMAEALARKEASEFIQGAGTVADPISGLAANAVISTQAAGAAPYIDDAITAAENLRTLGRYPNAIWISASLAKIWRQAKGTGGGARTIGAQVGFDAVRARAAGLDCDGVWLARQVVRGSMATRTRIASYLAERQYPAAAIRSVADDAWVARQLERRR